MGTARKTITVTEQQDSWIEAQISSGQFTNDSEYIRDLIRRDQASQVNLEAIRAALIEGENSGEAKPFDSRDWRAGPGECKERTATTKPQHKSIAGLKA